MTLPPASDVIRAEIVRLGGSLATTTSVAIDELWQKVTWPPDRWFRVGPRYEEPSGQFGIVDVDRDDGGGLLDDHPDAICFGTDGNGFQYWFYLPGTGGDGDPLACETDSTFETMSDPVPLSEFLGRVEVDVAASSISIPHEPDRFFRSFTDEPIFAFTGRTVNAIRLTDGITCSILDSGVVEPADSLSETEQFLRQRSLSLHNRIAAEIPPPVRYPRGPVPPVEGRFFRTACGALAFVVAADAEGADVLLLSEIATSFQQESITDAGDLYRVDGRGLFEGPNPILSRPKASLAAMLSLDTDTAWQKGAATAPAASKVQTADSRPLSAAAIREIQRLGGTVSATPMGPSAEWNGHALPEAIRQWMDDVRWPSDMLYRNEIATADIRVWGFQPGSFHFHGMRLFRYYPEIVGIGIADGGNYYVFTILYCDDPTDPPVYRLDHDSDENTPDGPTPLSEFLASLNVDVKSRRP